MATLKGLAALRKAGGVLSREPILTPVTWKHTDRTTGEEHEDTIDAWIVIVDTGMQHEMYADFNEKARNNQMALFISKTVLFDNEKGGRDPISYELAQTFDPTLTVALFKAASEVNSGPKNLKELTSSSASSSVPESEDEPSKTPEPT